MRVVLGYSVTQIILMQFRCVLTSYLDMARSFHITHYSTHHRLLPRAAGKSEPSDE